MDTLAFESGPFANLEFAIASLTGHEAINELFDFTLMVTVDRYAVEPHLYGGSEAAERLLLGARARMAMGEADARATRWGVVVEARFEGILHRTGDSLVCLQLRIAPTAWLATQQRRSRIFQKLYLHEIVSSVLQASGVNHRWQLTSKYPRRLYCTQYDETDWAYVTRLLAEEGIWFYFEHTESFVPLPGAADPGAVSSRTAQWLGVAADIAKPLSQAGLGTVGNALGPEGAAGALGIAADFATPDGAADPDGINGEAVELAQAGGTGAVGLPGPGDVLVFIDSPKSYTLTPLTLTRRDDGDLVGDSFVALSYSSAGAIRPSTTETRDYDFRKPLVLLRCEASEPSSMVATPYGRLAREVYAHHGEHETPDIDTQNARALLEQVRSRAALRRATTNCPLLMPGHLFELQNGTLEPVAEGTYAMVRVRHDAVDPTLLPPGVKPHHDAVVRGAARAVREALAMGNDLSETDLQNYIRRALDAPEGHGRPYYNFTEFVGSDVAARPSRPPRVTHNVTATATVMGPRGEDVYVDKFGRIKIQFHWDREGQWDEHSSCWVRVVQAWGGAGFGFQFIPRVGMEVLVTFLEGDPDRPVVLGSLYNGTHEVPEPLPMRKTRSVIRTQTVPDGGGFNEVGFEDEKNNERLWFRAQKDMETIVGDSNITTVRGDDVRVVGGSHSTAVTQDQRTGISQNHVLLVGANQSLHVGGNQVARVAQNATSYIDGNSMAEVNGLQMESVHGDAVSLVHGTRALNTHGDLRISVGSGGDTNVTSLASTFVHGTHSTVAHTISVSAADLLDNAETNVIVFQCGDSSIELHPDEIKIRSKKITMLGTDSAVMQSSASALRLEGAKGNLVANPLTLSTGKGGRLHLDGADADVHGSTIALSSDSDSANTDASKDPAKQPNVKIAVTYGPPDAKQPLAGVPYWVQLKAGRTEGTTGSNGEVEFHADDDETSATVQLFGNADLQAKYPAYFLDLTQPLEFVVKIAASVPPAGSLPGTRFRLRNLGYDPSTDLNHVGNDPSTTEALRQYQRDKRMAASTTPDEATKSVNQDAAGSHS